MNIRVLFLLFCSLVLMQGFAQLAPVIEWQRNYGGSDLEEANAIEQTSDGGYIVAGFSRSIDGDVTNAHGNVDYWIAKLDISGSIQWQTSLGGSSGDQALDISQTSDGGYIIAGTSRSTNGDVTNNLGNYDCWIVKLDDSGTIEWEKTYGGSGLDWAFSIVQTSEGGYIFAGQTQSTDGDVTNNHGYADFWIVKLDMGGTVEWEETYGGFSLEEARSIAQTSDGGYIVGGISGFADGDVSTNQGVSDCWIVKLDGSGTIEWQRSIGGSEIDEANSIAQTNDGGYIVAGYTLSTNGDVTGNNGTGESWIVKLNGLGEMEWQNTYGGGGVDAAYSIVQTIDGGYVFAGQSGSIGEDVTGNHGMSDSWVVKLDNTGIIEWEKSLGGSNSEIAHCIIQTSDGGFVVSGYTESPDGDVTNSLGGKDYWVVKLTNEFNLIIGQVYGDLNSNGLFDVSEPLVDHHNVHLDDGSRQTWSNSDGTYSLEVLTLGSFVVEPAARPYYNSVPANHSATFTAFRQTDTENDFAFQPFTVANDLSVSIAPTTAFRPGFPAEYTINYQNIGTTALTPTIQLELDQLLVYSTSSISPTSVNLNSISWALPQLGPLTGGTIILTVDVDQDAVLGSYINSPVVIEPVIGDADATNNSAAWPVVVTGSFDPNDIQVDRITLALDELITPPDLNYLIRFQNTGTDTAFTVRVDDVLPPDVQFTSFQFVGSSHPVEIGYNTTDNKLSFRFNNILLPDSNTNETASHGYVWYRIKPISTLMLGDSVLNQAAIFFDFNEAVVTDTAYTVIEQTTSIGAVQGSHGFSVSPNPAKGSLLMCTAEVQPGTTLTLSDALGREVLTESMNSTTHMLTVGELPRGVYVVSLRSGPRREYQRVVLE